MKYYEGLDPSGSYAGSKLYTMKPYSAGVIRRPMGIAEHFKSWDRPGRDHDSEGLDTMKAIMVQHPMWLPNVTNKCMEYYLTITVLYDTCDYMYPYRYLYCAYDRWKPNKWWRSRLWSTNHCSKGGNTFDAS